MRYYYTPVHVDAVTRGASPGSRRGDLIERADIPDSVGVPMLDLQESRCVVSAPGEYEAPAGWIEKTREDIHRDYPRVEV